MPEITPEPPSSEHDDAEPLMANIPDTRVPVANRLPSPITPLPTPYGNADPYPTYDRAERRLMSSRAALSSATRRHMNNPPSWRPVSQIPTRLLPRAPHVIDTAAGNPNQARARNISSRPNPLAPYWPRISAEDTIAHLPYNLVRQLGLDSVDIELVDRLIDTSPEYRWPMSVLLMVSAQQGPVRQNDPRLAPPRETRSPSYEDTFAFDQSFNEYVMYSVRAILLDGTLDYYSHPTHTTPARSVNHPMALMTDHIRSSFDSGQVDLDMLPPGWNFSEPTAIVHIRRLIQENINEEKPRLRRAVMVKISPFSSAHGPIPNLDELLAYVWNKQQPGRALHPAPLEPPPLGRMVDRVRIAHTRLHMLDYKYGWRVPSSSNWDTFDRDLQALAARDSIYRQAHANAILLRDSQLFNGLNTLASIPERARRLPNEQEIDHQIMLIEVETTISDLGQPEHSPEPEEA
ncbi:uncharacterized protein PGTG_20951 [Puccinia graminis f. sp. tritici CRL 75-36-700-3]|uniref:Uncharacterized protein n=1 Tax=Puccinia graminis f. sp. tritici (strain CRL 75-36-700-3 / race SCCL) TaxID=418459 RepID=H6QQ05_PUCGT|nr:uncharacterized protein PGTG_20951 [Puccinia graminis f. sp. tritici CRL 75-36-700-3]EHS64488.1 hypothetical protein PGTG_20951 [Puccinia graminis f. sp. tritici CRL 75-36-700-3]